MPPAPTAPPSAAPNPFLQQPIDAAPAGGLRNPLQFDTLQAFLVAILDALILILFPFLVLALVYAGFKFVAAQGKAEALVEARRAFLWVLIGALIILGAKALSMAIQATVDDITVNTVNIEMSPPLAHADPTMPPTAVMNASPSRS
jgi:hypothetical protein